MSGKEISEVSELKVMVAKLTSTVDGIGERSDKWRGQMDEKFEKMDVKIEKANELTNLSHTMLRDEMVDVKKEITAINLTTKAHSLDIEFVNDLKQKATWSWKTAKFLTGFSIGAFGLIATIYHGFLFLKDYFKNG